MDNDFKNKPNNGSLWTQTAKKKPTSPDVTGKLKIKISDINIVTEQDEEGNEIEVAEIKISGWRKTTKTGKKFLSISLNTYDDNPTPVAPKVAKVPEDDDEIPF